MLGDTITCHSVVALAFDDCASIELICNSVRLNNARRDRWSTTRPNKQSF